MIVFIKDVEIGAFDWSAKPENQIINFWIIGQLRSGRKIKIFDFERFNLTDYKDHEVEGLIFAMVITYGTSLNFERIKGEFIKECPQILLRNG